MARKRPTASNDRPLRSGVDAVRPITDALALTRAEARALARSAPLTGAPLTAEQFRLRSRLVEQGISPLRQR